MGLGLIRGIMVDDFRSRLCSRSAAEYIFRVKKAPIPGNPIFSLCSTLNNYNYAKEIIVVVFRTIYHLNVNICAYAERADTSHVHAAEKRWLKVLAEKLHLLVENGNAANDQNNLDSSVLISSNENFEPSDHVCDRTILASCQSADSPTNDRANDTQSWTDLLNELVNQQTANDATITNSSQSEQGDTSSQDLFDEKAEPINQKNTSVIVRDVEIDENNEDEEQINQEHLEMSQIVSQYLDEPQTDEIDENVENSNRNACTNGDAFVAEPDNDMFSSDSSDSLHTAALNGDDPPHEQIRTQRSAKSPPSRPASGVDLFSPASPPPTPKSEKRQVNVMIDSQQPGPSGLGANVGRAPSGGSLSNDQCIDLVSPSPSPAATRFTGSSDFIDLSSQSQNVLDDRNWIQPVSFPPTSEEVKKWAESRKSAAVKNADPESIFDGKSDMEIAETNLRAPLSLKEASADATRSEWTKIRVSCVAEKSPEFCQCIVVEDEKRLLSTAFDVIERYDPDILVGYETQRTSWGYFVQRAKFLRLPDAETRLSRNLPQSDSKQSTSKSSATPQQTSMDHPVIPNADTLHTGGQWSPQAAGRHFLTVWPIMRHEFGQLRSYDFEPVVAEVLHERVPRFETKSLDEWWQRGGDARSVCHRHYLHRCKTTLRLLIESGLVARVSEMARLYGIQFIDVVSRGSQYRVESMLLRLARSQNYVALSPTVQHRNQFVCYFDSSDSGCILKAPHKLVFKVPSVKTHYFVFKFI